jgi:hypothetical protein
MKLLLVLLSVLLAGCVTPTSEKEYRYYYYTWRTQNPDNLFIGQALQQTKGPFSVWEAIKDRPIISSVESYIEITNGDYMELARYMTNTKNFFGGSEIIPMDGGF